MDNHVGRLVYDKEVLVLMKDIQRDGFGLGLSRLRWQQVDLDALSFVQQPRGANLVSVDPHEALFDPALRLRAARVLDVVWYDSIDPDAFFFRSHDPTHSASRVLRAVVCLLRTQDGRSLDGFGARFATEKRKSDNGGN